MPEKYSLTVDNVPYSFNWSGAKPATTADINEFAAYVQTQPFHNNAIKNRGRAISDQAIKNLKSGLGIPGVPTGEIKSAGLPNILNQRDAEVAGLNEMREQYLAGPTAGGMPGDYPGQEGLDSPVYHPGQAVTPNTSIYHPDSRIAAANKKKLAVIDSQLAKWGIGQQPSDMVELAPHDLGSINQLASSLVTGTPYSQANPSVIGGVMNAIQPGSDEVWASGSAFDGPGAGNVIGKFASRASRAIAGVLEPSNLLAMGAAAPLLKLGGVAQAALATSFAVPQLKQAHEQIQSGDTEGGIISASIALFPFAVMGGFAGKNAATRGRDALVQKAFDTSLKDPSYIFPEKTRSIIAKSLGIHPDTITAIGTHEFARAWQEAQTQAFHVEAPPADGTEQPTDQAGAGRFGMLDTSPAETAPTEAPTDQTLAGRFGNLEASPDAETAPSPDKPAGSAVELNSQPDGSVAPVGEGSPATAGSSDWGGSSDWRGSSGWGERDNGQTSFSTIPQQPLELKPSPESGASLQSQAAANIASVQAHIAGALNSDAEVPVRVLREVKGSLHALLSPPSVSADAGSMKRIITAHNAAFAQQTENATDTLRAYQIHFNKMTEAGNLDFIHRSETGDKQYSAALQVVSDALNHALGIRVAEVQRLSQVHGLHLLENLITNYFPHFWQPPTTQAGRDYLAMSRRPIAGTGAFLRQRTFDTTKEGMANGLVPVTTNPIDLMLLKVREIDKFLMGQNIFQEAKTTDVGTAIGTSVPIFMARYVKALDPPPEGWTKLDDKIASVSGGTSVEVKEAYDKQMSDSISNVINELSKVKPVEDIRSLNIGGKGVPAAAWGVAHGDESIVTKAAGTLAIKIHELGHVLDIRYGLGQHLSDPKLVNEMKILAAMRGANQSKAYVEKPEELVANALTAYITAPELMKAHAPKTKRAIEKLITSHTLGGDKALKLIQDIKPSLELETKMYDQQVGGIITRGHYYAPDAAARIFNNHLSPGVRNSLVAPIYNGMMYFNNGLNQAQLGLSGFHALFVGMDSAISQASVANQYLHNKQYKAAAKELVKTPFAVFNYYNQGSKVLRDYYKAENFNGGGPISKEIAQAIAGGMRARSDSAYRTEAGKQMVAALKASRPLTALFHFPFAIFEKAAIPIMEHLVPAVKMGSYLQLAKFELQKLPQTASKDEVRYVLQRAADSIDNRMGQMVYDNLFWHRTTKEIIQILLRAPGWKGGTIRELLGAVVDLLPHKMRGGAMPDLGDGIVPNPRMAIDPKGITPRQSYAMAIYFVHMLTAMMITYVLTGDRPRSILDLLHPRTGRMHEDGTPERISINDYTNEIEGYMHDPAQMILNALAPGWQTVKEQLTNKDFNGDQVFDPDAPLLEQLKDRGKAILKGYTPLSVRPVSGAFPSSNRPATGQQGKISKFITDNGGILGVKRAPAYLDRTDAQLRIMQYIGEGMGTGGKTDNMQAQNKVRTAYHAAQDEATRTAVADKAVADGTLSPAEANKLGNFMSKDFWESKFKNLNYDHNPEGFEKQLRVYNMATPEEKQSWGGDMMKSFNQWAKGRNYQASPLYKMVKMSGLDAN